MKTATLYKQCQFALIINCIFITYLLAIFSCNDHPTDKPRLAEQKQKDSSGHLQKPPSSFNDTLRINETAAVFFSPDTVQLEKLKKTSSIMQFETMTHESFFQMRNARIVLKKNLPPLKIIETSKNRFLLFTKKDGSQTCIDLDKKGEAWGLYLFSPEKEPELVDMMNIETASGFYFNKK